MNFWLQVNKVKDQCNKNLKKLMEELQYMEMVSKAYILNIWDCPFPFSSNIYFGNLRSLEK